jgi:tetratricopeptide (TPR) repeat protein
MNRFHSSGSHSPDPLYEQHDDDFAEFDIWCEQHLGLLAKKDYPALVEHCRRRATEYPEDPYAQIRLGEAYTFNREYQRAIEWLTPYHKRDPKNMDYHHVVLDALYAMGKTEDDFEWTEKPDVLRMSDKLLDSCFNILTRKRKRRSVSELYGEFIPKAYLLFSEEDLLSALLGDDRFVVTNAHEGVSAEVQVIRGGEKQSL